MHSLFKKNILFILCLTFLTLLLAGCGDDANYDEGLRAYKAEDYSKAFKILKPLAEQGHPEARDYLVRMYFFGEGVRKDIKQAVKLIRIGAEEGRAKSQSSLAFMYVKG